MIFFCFLRPLNFIICFCISVRKIAIVILMCIVAVLGVIGIFILWLKFKSKHDPSNGMYQYG